MAVITSFLQKKMMRTTLMVFAFCLYFTVASAQDEVFIKSGEAIRGYDAVAYFMQGMAVKGIDKFQFEWNSAIWKFSSAENLKSFQSEPEKYAPQFGGFCAYGVADGHKAPTDPDAWTIVDGRLYLNYDKGVRELWSKSREEFIKTAEKNWPKVKLEKD
jgi:hypothetical protein